MLKIKDVTVKVGKKVLLKDFNLCVRKGEIHVIMGPNGAGKSTFSKMILGYPHYKIIKGEILYKNEDLKKVSIEKRSKKGIFASFQNPMEIENISNIDFLCAIYNSRWNTSFTNEEFKKRVIEKKKLKISFLERGVNFAFSGGEKKKNEILQMQILSPDLAILDEIDSGLDIDSLKEIARKIKEFHSEKNAIILITHYPRILNYITADFVHILLDGSIVKTGKKELAEKLEEKGYRGIL